jgi:transketolase
MKERLEEIDQLSKQNERRKFYKALDKAKRGFQPSIIRCKTKTGKVICEDRKALERWEEHFKELLNKEVEDERMERDETDVESVRGRKKGKRRKEEE